VESWLIRVFRQAVAEYPNFEWTFFCVLPRPGEFDEAVQTAGGRVIHSRHEIGQKIPFLSSLRRVMRAGRYDVLHCHHDIMSAAYLLASAGLPLQKRIVHLHNTSLSLPTPNRVKADLVREPMRQVCLRMADQIVGISQDALESLIGKRTPDPARHRVVHYAVDTTRFRQGAPDPVAFRKDLGLSPLAKILLFVGRMTEYKNPLFVIEVLEQLATIDESVVAVFAGKGDQENELRQIVERKSLGDRVRMLGFRDDVPELMMSSDVLMWPSIETPREGLGLGIVEAQAAGLPILMSRSVPEEAIIVPELVRVLPLAAGAGKWAEGVNELLQRSRLNRHEALARVEASSFSMAAGVSNFMALYQDLKQAAA
jgi:glycosyltransferase involved in cell wall biosynthesis